MTVYVTGDMHGRAEYGSSRFAFKSWPLGRTLTRDDVVIVAVDQAGDGIGLREAKARADVLYGVTGLR